MAEILAAVDLTVRFGDVVALDGVSFRIDGPGLVGILGPNGAGKTTLLDILEGLRRPTSGHFRLFGAAPEPYPRRRVGVVLQDEARLDRVTAREYAELFAAIYGVAGGAQRMLDRVGLGHRATTAIDKLSGGEAARLWLAGALVHDPDLVFLDEPTAALDPDSKRSVGALLRELARDRAIVMTTHDLREADGLYDELLFLVGGRLRASGSRTELLADLPAGATVEDAFFHYCAVRIRGGEEVA